MKLTILMPSLNEEEGIKKTINEIPIQQIKNLGYEVEILVVDGGSTDRTKEVAKENGAKIIQTKKGYGRQYKFGFSQPLGDIIITADSDGSYPMNEIPKLLKIFQKENLDFINTNRFAKMTKGSMKPINLFGNKILTFLTNFLFSLNLKDSQSGMWILKKEMLPKITLKSNGMSLSQEIKIEAFKKFKAKEIDSSYQKRVGKIKLKTIKDGLANVFHLFRKKLFD